MDKISVQELKQFLDRIKAIFDEKEELKQALTMIMAAWDKIPDGEYIPDELGDQTMWDYAARVLRETSGG